MPRCAQTHSASGEHNETGVPSRRSEEANGTRERQRAAKAVIIHISLVRCYKRDSYCIFLRAEQMFKLYVCRSLAAALNNSRSVRAPLASALSLPVSLPSADRRKSFARQFNCSRLSECSPFFFVPVRSVPRCRSRCQYQHDGGNNAPRICGAECTEKL